MHNSKVTTYQLPRRGIVIHYSMMTFIPTLHRVDIRAKQHISPSISTYHIANM